MPDHDPLGSDQNLFDEQTSNTLTLRDGRARCRLPQPGGETAQVLCQRKVRLLVERLCLQSLQLRCQAGFPLAQRRQSPPQFGQG